MFVLFYGPLSVFDWCYVRLCVLCLVLAEWQGERRGNIDSRQGEGGVYVLGAGGVRQKERDSWVLIEHVPSHQTQATQHHNYLNPPSFNTQITPTGFFFFFFTGWKRKHWGPNDQISSKWTWAATHLAAVAKVFRVTWYGPGGRQVASQPPFFNPVHSCSGQHLIKTSKLPVTNLE